MRKLRTAIAALACLAVLANEPRLVAHHSFSAEFDASQPVSLEGAVSRVEWRNPHAWFYIDVADRAGHVVTWAVEASTPSALARRGLLRETLPPGARVIVRGYRAKNGTQAVEAGTSRSRTDARCLSATRARGDRRSSYRDGFLPAVFLSIALAPLRIPNIP